ncbi:Monovalent Cation:Proton Antiporter-1 (CPA1) Family [Trachipleistophora hominis]|uniref:Monovalent Cation:Proton Antiporter-1 (CPA1) Family n=1 Tax=Trachipleistophora hominis TaxID=72359 RepID=L7JZI6_TRAHO|nr:Monovalent Cation:Proton Antiporter-1 (CPA1) Family [Trachipleistophora hominis]
MDDFFLVVCFVSLFILAFGLVSNFVKEKLFLSEPTVSIIFGILIGPYVLNVLNTSYIESKIVMYHFARVVLCIQVMTAAMSLPQGYILKQAKSLFVLVIVVSIAKYFITFIIVYSFSHYNAAVSLAIAACLTPTDPILSSSIVKSKFADENVPERLRTLLSAESGINDGVGLSLLFFPLHIFYSENMLVGLKNYFLNVILYQCMLPIVLGVFIGYFSRKMLKYCYGNDLVGIESFLIYGLALTFFCLGLMETIKSSELICIFFTGALFSWDEWFVLETRESRLQEVTDSLFSTSFFVFFGSRIDFTRITVPVIVSSILIICLRRTFPCLLLFKFIPQIRTKREALFVGWFGPIGVAALYYALLIDRILDTLTIDFVSVVVLFSVIIHGLTVPLFKLSSVKKESRFLGLIAPTRVYDVNTSPQY